MMRKLSIFLLLALALWSCAKQEQAPQAEWKSALKAVENNLIFTPEGGDATITLNENVTSAVCSASWLTSSVNGKVVTLTSEPFTGGQSRYASLQLKSAAGDLLVPVVQYGVIIDGLSIPDIDAPVEGLVKTQVIRMNTAFHIEADEDWIHPEYDAVEGILTIRIDANVRPGTRLGTIRYAAGAESGTVRVRQEPPIARENGWTLTPGTSYYEDPDFFLPLSVTAGASDYYVLSALYADDVEGEMEPWIFSQLAPARKKAIEAKVAAEGGSFKDYLTQGSVSGLDLLLPGFGDCYVIAVGFGENGYVTGQYQWIRVTVKDTRPGFFYDNGGEDMDWGTF